MSKQDKWISCKETLPPINKQVLISREGEWETKGSLNRLGSWSIEYKDGVNGKNPTHWAYIRGGSNG